MTDAASEQPRESVADTRGQWLATAVRRDGEVKVPLVGGKLENSIGADLADNIVAFQRFTTEWIAEHGMKNRLDDVALAVKASDTDAHQASAQ